MPISDRAAIFSPFAALTGHAAALAETARLTECRVELSEEERSELDRRQAILLAHISEQPEITVTCFVPDEKKDGGAYITVAGRLKRIDQVERTMLLTDGTCIPLDNVANLGSDWFQDTVQIEYE